MEKSSRCVTKWKKQVAEYVEYAPVSVKTKQNDPVCVYKHKPTQLLSVVGYLWGEEWDWRSDVRQLFPFFFQTYF